MLFPVMIFPDSRDYNGSYIVIALLCKLNTSIQIEKIQRKRENLLKSFLLLDKNKPCLLVPQLCQK